MRILIAAAVALALASSAAAQHHPTPPAEDACRESAPPERCHTEAEPPPKFTDEELDEMYDLLSSILRQMVKEGGFGIHEERKPQR